MASKRKILCNCMQCDGKLAALSSDIDSATENVNVSSACKSINTSAGNTKKPVPHLGECTTSPDIEILKVTSAKVSRKVKIIKLHGGDEDEVQAVKYIPGNVSQRCDKVGVDVSDCQIIETEAKKRPFTRKNDPIDLTSPPVHST